RRLAAELADLYRLALPTYQRRIRRLLAYLHWHPGPPLYARIWLAPGAQIGRPPGATSSSFKYGTLEADWFHPSTSKEVNAGSRQPGRCDMGRRPVEGQGRGQRRHQPGLQRTADLVGRAQRGDRGEDEPRRADRGRPRRLLCDGAVLWAGQRRETAAETRGQRGGDLRQGRGRLPDRLERAHGARLGAGAGRRGLPEGRRKREGRVPGLPGA